MSKTRENINVVEKISYSSHTITSQFAPSAMHCNNPVVNQLPQDIGLLHIRFLLSLYQVQSHQSTSSLMLVGSPIDLRYSTASDLFNFYCTIQMCSHTNVCRIVEVVERFCCNTVRVAPIEWSSLSLIIE